MGFCHRKIAATNLLRGRPLQKNSQLSLFCVGARRMSRRCHPGRSLDQSPVRKRRVNGLGMTRLGAVFTKTPGERMSRGAGRIRIRILPIAAAPHRRPCTAILNLHSKCRSGCSPAKPRASRAHRRGVPRGRPGAGTRPRLFKLRRPRKPNLDKPGL
jgi:hypothetical protein